MQERRQRRHAGDAMPRASNADSDRQCGRSGPDGVKSVERRARPSSTRRLKKGAALRRGFEKTLLRWSERGGKLGDGVQSRVVAGLDGAVGVNEEHGVAKAAAFSKHHSEPFPQSFGVLDVTGLDRPFDAARIGKGADR